MATVCLFLPTGRTYTFRDATVIQDNETVLVLKYIAMSDAHEGFLTVQKSAVVGWSVKP